MLRRTRSLPALNCQPFKIIKSIIIIIIMCPLHYGSHELTADLRLEVPYARENAEYHDHVWEMGVAESQLNFWRSRNIVKTVAKLHLDENVHETIDRHGICYIS